MAAQKADNLAKLTNWNRIINQRVQKKEKECQDLRKAIKNIKCSANSACDEIERMFAELLVFIEKKHLEVKKLLRVKEEKELREAERVLNETEMEIVFLHSRSSEIERILQSSDHIGFLQSLWCMSCPSWTEDSVSSPANYRVTFEGVVHSVLELLKNLEDICNSQMSNILEKQRLKPETPLNPAPVSEPRTREDFLNYSCYLTLDFKPNHTNLRVNVDNRAVEWVPLVSSVSKWPQVICREGLIGRCYWEAEWHGSGVCTVGLCEGGQRQEQGLVMGFGRDALSWGLDCFHLTYMFHHGNENITIPAPKSITRVGVYLDHRAGTLSFYSVSNNITLLHRVHTRFTQPLYPGFALWTNGWQSSTHSYNFKNFPLKSETGHMSLKLVNL